MDLFKHTEILETVVTFMIRNVWSQKSMANIKFQFLYLLLALEVIDRSCKFSTKFTDVYFIGFSRYHSGIMEVETNLW